MLSSILAIGVTVGLASQPLRWLQKLELKTWDWRLRQLAEPPAGNSPIHLVVIDDESVKWGKDQDFGDFPRWTREIYEMALDFCKEARAVVFVLEMAEKDEYDGDSRFASFMNRHDSTVAILGLQISSVAGEGYTEQWPEELKSRFDWDDTSDPGQRALFAMPFAKFPQPVLARSASALGHFQKSADMDHVVRRLKPFVLFDDGIVPSPGLAAYGATAGATQARQPKTPMLGLEDGSLEYDGRLVPLDDDGNIVLRPRKLESGEPYRFPSSKIEDVVQGYYQLKRGETPDLDPAVFMNRYVFVGRTRGKETFSNVDSMSDLEMSATMLDNFLAQDFIYPRSRWSRLSLTLLLSLACALSMVLLDRIWLTAPALAGWMAIPWVIARLAYPQGHFWPIVEPVFGVLLAGLGGLAIRYAASRLRVDLHRRSPEKGLNRLREGITRTVVGTRNASRGRSKSPARQESDLRALLREKLEEFRKERALATDAGQKFALKKRIEEIEQEIEKLKT